MKAANHAGAGGSAPSATDMPAAPVLAIRPPGGSEAGASRAVHVDQSMNAGMKRITRSFLRLVGALILASALVARPAMAQQILRDAETEAFLNEISRPLVQAAGLDPRNAQVLLINDQQINAFTAGGQIVWLNSGLVTAADNANQVQGVIAHELGHIEGGHVLRSGEGMKAATGITLLSLVLGAAAMAAGGAEAGMGIIGAGQQAAMGKYLAFSRNQESSADLAGARYLAKSGISGQGSLQFFRKLQNLEYRYRVNDGTDDGYGTTHPMSADRIAILSDLYEKDPAWNVKNPALVEAKFQRIKAKLFGYVSDPPQTMRTYPESDQTIPAHYARAYAWHKSAYPDKALAEADALLKALPRDPYFLELKGQILLESGRASDAIAPLREAVAQSNSQPLIAVLLSHALIATEDERNFAEAEAVLRNAVTRDRENPFAWYQLGVVYEHRGDSARAALATAERYSLEGNPALAKRSAETAMAGLKPGTGDYLRAQDIAMASAGEMDDGKKKKKKK